MRTRRKEAADAAGPGSDNRLDDVMDMLEEIRDSVEDAYVLRNPVMTADEAARMLRISTRSLWDLAAEGAVQKVQVKERATRITTASVLAHIRRRAAGGRA
jgi:hypothetical protein